MRSSCRLDGEQALHLAAIVFLHRGSPHGEGVPVYRTGPCCWWGWTPAPFFTLLGRSASVIPHRNATVLGKTGMELPLPRCSTRASEGHRYRQRAGRWSQSCCGVVLAHALAVLQFLARSWEVWGLPASSAVPADSGLCSAWEGGS